VWSARQHTGLVGERFLASGGVYAVGNGRNEVGDADLLEIDLLFDLPISKRLWLSGYAVCVNFSVPVEYNYYKLGTALSLSF